MKLRQLFRPRSVTVSAIIGGLGNQMFQYAAGRAIARHHGHRLVLDTSPLQDKGQHTARPFELHAYRIQAEVDALSQGTLRRLIKVREPREPGPWPSGVPAGARIEGFWQNPAYFHHIRDELIKDFELLAPPSAHGQAMAARIQAAPQAVSMHFRRGDYVTNSVAAAYHGTCTPAYYAEALSVVNSQLPGATCFVFSDDPDWVRAECHLPERHLLIDARQSTSFEDIWLMSLCQHHIVANSSFSWWGAWLSQSPGLKIAPRHWYADPQAAAAERIVPSGWMRL